MRVHFTIAGRPRGKARARASARIVGRGDAQRAAVQMHVDEDTAAAEHEIARLYRVAALAQLGRDRRAITAGPVRIDLLAVFPYGDTTFPRAVQRAAEECRLLHISAPDLDNIEKLVKDALNKTAWRDDGQVAQVTKTKRYGRPGRVEVTVTHIAQREDEKTPGQRVLEKRVAREGWDAVLAQEDAGSNRSKTRARERQRAKWSWEK